jgi:hypothetical protein
MKHSAAARVLFAAWVITFLSARVSAELATAVGAATWIAAAVVLLGRNGLIAVQPISLGGVIATALAMLWWSGSYGVVDPYSAWTWCVGWGPPALAAVVVGGRRDLRPQFLGCVALLGALVGFGAILVWASSPGRASFLLTNPNSTAAVLIACLPCAFIETDTRRRWGLVAVMVLGVAVTGSRGGFLALAVQGAIWLLWRRDQRRAWIAAAVVVLLLAPFVVQRLSAAVSNPYAQGRVGWWKSAARVGRASPAGVGTRQFGWYGLRQRAYVEAPVYRYLRGEPGESAHSEPLQLLADHGVVGPLLLLFLVAACFRRRPFVPEHAALLGLLVHSCVDGTWQSGVVRTLSLVLALTVWRRGPWLPLALPRGVAVVVAALWAALALPGGVAQVIERKAVHQARLAAGDPALTAALDRAAHWAPLDPDPPAFAAALHLGAGRIDAAIAAASEALQRAPARPSLRRQIATIYAAAAAADPGSAAAHRVAALKARLAAVGLEPMHAVDRFELAAAALALGYPRRARQALQVAIGLEPNFRLAHLALARVDAEMAPLHRQRAEAVRAQLLARYCSAERSDCGAHLRTVMTGLELRLVGDLVHGGDDAGVAASFGTWPVPPIAPWPEEVGR